MTALESGVLFEHAGIINMLNGDFFSWYLDNSNMGSLFVNLLIRLLFDFLE